ncbi:MAG: hypothetical protein AMS18_08715 [Gemmatimonas sp. SG8_17]|nr:MAG: hypothetical protein AMS18_08715 [Gemmatimonas sp. SG8_17]
MRTSGYTKYIRRRRGAVKQTYVIQPDVRCRFGALVCIPARSRYRTPSDATPCNEAFITASASYDLITQLVQFRATRYVAGTFVDTGHQEILLAETFTG